MTSSKLRQRIRKTLLIVALLLFPAVYYYLSPYLIIMGAQEGVVNGSLIMFSLQFFSALLLGRAWCGWVCPAGSLHHVCRMVNDKPVAGGKWNWIKFIIWVPWLSLIVFTAISAGGYTRIDFFYQTEQGFSATAPHSYILFYLIVGFLALLAIIIGRMAPCHYICWMSPFMILGSKIRYALKLPSLHLRVQTENCINCTRCERHCPMSLNVNAMVQRGSMQNSECVLCGECVDACPNSIIRYAFGKPQ
jgi:polyferredoxin